MSDLIRCSCDGAQENCSRCSGSGFFIPPSLAGGALHHLKIAPVAPKRIWTKSFEAAAAEVAAERAVIENARLRDRFGPSIPDWSPSATSQPGADTIAHGEIP